MTSSVFVPEIVIPLTILISLLFGYSYYKNSNSHSAICAFVKLLGVMGILIIVGNLSQTAANVII